MARTVFWNATRLRLACLLACLVAIALTAAITHPAINTGDYGRTSRSFDIEIAMNTAPTCPVFKPELSSPPASPASILGMALGGITRASGGDCLAMSWWFALLSAMFWGGVLVLAAPLAGRRLVAVCGIAVLSYLLFAELIDSFYEEAFFAALIPWLAQVRFGTWRRTALALGIAGLALIAKAQAIFLVPVLVLLFRERSVAPRWREWALLGAVIVVALGFNAVKAHHYSGQNAYNRIYAGLGWTALDAAHWPPVEFFARRDYLYAQRQSDPDMLVTQCAPDDEALLGTSYWPTANAIVTGRLPVSAQARADVQNLGLRDFIACAREIGHPLRTLGQIYAITIRSDYNLAYLRSVPPPRPLVAVADLRNALLRWAAPLFLAFAVIAALTLRSRFFALSAAYIVVLSPLFVFVGDGFYEFEKHMMLNYMMLAACALVALGAGARRRAIMP